MSTYKLPPPEQATLDSRRDKGEVFGLVCRKDGWWYYANTSFGCLTDDAAYALMVQRGLKELAEMWNLPFFETLHLIASRLRPGCTDMLAAIIAALEDKR